MNDGFSMDMKTFMLFAGIPSSLKTKCSFIDELYYNKKEQTFLYRYISRITEPIISLIYRGDSMPRKKNISDNDIIQLYLDGASSEELSEYSGLTMRAVRNILHKYNIPMRKVGQPRKHQLNESFFKEWSNEMAWVLGLIVTDGCLNKDQYTITIAQKSTEILRKIANVMNSDFIINKNNTPSLLLNSKTMYKDLEKIGITPNKSLTTKIPNIPEQYLPHFIRGVIDGDGWIQDKGYVMNITTASIDFANGLYNIFAQWNLKTEIKPFKTKNNKPYYRVWIKGKTSVQAVAKIIYNDDCDLCIGYKKQRMTQWNEVNHHVD